MNIHEILEKCKSLRIAVVGDMIYDHYIIGEVDRISPEAPVPVVRITSEYTTDGGAGNVVNNLRNLGVNIGFYFDNENVSKKTRIMSSNQHMIRIDEDKRCYKSLLDFEWCSELINCIENKFYNCVILSDYHKGVISQNLANFIINKCKEADIPVVVDAKKDFHKFKGATILKCNRKEYLHLLEKAPPFPNTREWLGVKYHIVTLGEQGISIYYDDDGEGFDGYKINQVDVCGAGDTVTAILGISVAGATVKDYDDTNIMQASILRGCILANIAASEVCQHPGVFPITKEALIRRFDEVNK